MVRPSLAPDPLFIYLFIIVIFFFFFFFLRGHNTYIACRILFTSVPWLEFVQP